MGAGEDAESSARRSSDAQRLGNLDDIVFVAKLDVKEINQTEVRGSRWRFCFLELRCAGKEVIRER